MIKLWSLESQKEVATLQGHNGWVRSIAFSPNSKYLASGSDDKTVKVWSMEKQKELITLRRHSHWVRSVSFSPEG